MRKRVILTLHGSSIEQGILVILRIRESDTSDEIVIQGELPPAPELLRAFNSWRSDYSQLQSSYRIIPNPGQVTNFSVRDVKSSGLRVEEELNKWLRSDSPTWKTIRDKLLLNLRETDTIQFSLQTDDKQIQQLPWNSWDLVSRSFTNIEIILSPQNYRQPPSRNNTEKVKILAILGDTTGINVENDTIILNELLPDDVEIEFFETPQREGLDKKLWSQQWDILFFAGHSHTEVNSNNGVIKINQNDSLTIEELRYSLQRVIRNGLQLAFFNSCDGLGLAQDLADLNIPQTIVMRAPVPNSVAQQFLKDFLQAFIANGRPLDLAVQEARQKLQGLEDRFPCASWLPVLCQNPNIEPLIWQDLALRPRHQRWLPTLKKAINQFLPRWQLKLIMLFFLGVVVAFGLWVCNIAPVNFHKINKIYQEVLSRDANPAEIVGHTIDLAKNTPFNDIRNEIANSKEAQDKINYIYQEVLNRDANPAEIDRHKIDLAKNTPFNDIRNEIANSKEAQDKINYIYQEVLNRDADSRELNSYIKSLATKKTLSLIRDEIEKTFRLLEDGNVISLECLGEESGPKILNVDVSTNKRLVNLIHTSSDIYPGTKWRTHKIRNGVIALENLGKVGDLKWLNGETYNGKVNLASSTDGGNTGTKWEFYIIDEGFILLKCLGHIDSSTIWLNGITFEEKVDLVSNTNGGNTGTEWKIIK